MKELWGLTRPYWQSEERWKAYGLLFVIVALNLGEVYLNVLFNFWNKDFYDSIQAVDEKAFFAALLRFTYLAFTFIAVAVYRVYLNQMLRIKWRAWMTNRYLSDWLGKQNYYRMQLMGSPTDNPDQRISEDIEQFIQLTLGLALGLLSSVVTLFSFLTILWRLSGALDFTLGGMAIHIPGYMFWAALIYAIAGTWLTVRVGRPLVHLNYNQQRFEADFRFSLVRLRENTESIAFYKGEAQEQENFVTRFQAVIGNFWAIMKRQKTLSWLTSGYSQLAIIFPYVVAAPSYFARKTQLGDLTQTASAFGQVQGSLSYIVDSYTSIATWRAVIDRLSGFTGSIRHAEATQAPTAGFERHASDRKQIEAKNLTIRLPDNRLLLNRLNLAIRPGDTLLITGRSGSGKSTLLRTLAGLWPFVEGELTLPAHASMLFVPQKPYLPLGTLRQSLYYPNAPQAEDSQLDEILSLCRLEHLKPRMDDSDLWSHILSLGEQQRIAFARILLVQPEFVFLDETTSALDESLEAHLYETLASRLPRAAIVSVGHRSTLRKWHKNELNLGGEA
ncbi:MAG: ABC transporter ATP-binding protein/permease [Pseudomonadota bacterium]|nr:ABC transporter ATP-binding protein/permease [Pseudomonadota bacterium]